LNRAGQKQLISSILLFLIVFGLWQVYYLIQIFNPGIQVYFTDAIYFAVYLFTLALFALFVKLEKSTLSEHGFEEPANMNQCLILSVFSIIFYLAVTLFPGFMSGFSSPPFPHTFFYFVFTVMNAIIVSVATESIFRGYIFKNTVDKQGFFPSLYVSSIMFSLYQIPVLTLATMSSNGIITYVFTDVLPVFAAGVFLGFFFYKTGWSLVGPIIFRIGILLYVFYPPVMATSPWWMNLTFQVTAYGCLIIILDTIIKEPRFQRRKYGLES
jgi:membrane protease YdiL (CAAX protease family)